MAETLQFRDDITCPKSGEPIPLDKFSISKFSDQLYLVHCPTCRVMHEFVPVAKHTSGERGNG